MPRVAASFWSGRLSKWWTYAGWADPEPGEWADSAMLDNLRRLLRRVLVGLLGHRRLALEVLGDRRGGRLPLEPLGLPGIGRRRPPVAHRPHEVDHRDEVPEAEDRRPR